jgi:CRP-like cAMP-binding protein
MGTATAVGATAALRIQKRDMLRIHEHRVLRKFIAHMLRAISGSRGPRRSALQLQRSGWRARCCSSPYGTVDTTQKVLPRLSQETLAEMVGTTRSRVNFFMNKFRRLGLIEYNGGLKVNSSLLSMVLHD